MYYHILYVGSLQLIPGQNHLDSASSAESFIFLGELTSTPGKRTARQQASLHDRGPK